MAHEINRDIQGVPFVAAVTAQMHFPMNRLSEIFPQTLHIRSVQ